MQEPASNPKHHRPTSGYSLSEQRALDEMVASHPECDGKRNAAVQREIMAIRARWVLRIDKLKERRPPPWTPDSHESLLYEQYIRRMNNAVEKVRDKYCRPAPAAGRATPKATASVGKPGAPLLGWKAILGALQVVYSPEVARSWRRLNDTESGPIRIVGKGKPPRVDKDKLLVWQHTLTERGEAADSKRRDTSATLAESYSHGRKSHTVLPGISGHAKHRVK